MTKLVGSRRVGASVISIVWMAGLLAVGVEADSRSSIPSPSGPALSMAKPVNSGSVANGPNGCEAGDRMAGLPHVAAKPHSPISAKDTPGLGGGEIAATSALRVVPRVNIDRYMGRWYEIARYPNSWQNGMVGVIAEYSRRADGCVTVVNSGHKGKLDGPLSRSEAVAWVHCHDSNAKLKVQFMWPFTADYWIIDLDEQYRYAVVGQPCRTRLWVLSREPQLDEPTYVRICERLRAQGYEPSRLERTPQGMGG